MSELPRSASDAESRVRARLIAATAPPHARRLTLVDEDGPNSLSGTRTPAPGDADTEPAPVASRESADSSRSRHHDDDLLTVAEAARIARRSVRTLQRAYRSGTLVAHRDGNGRGVSIRYGDLRAWLTAAVIGRRPPARTASRATARVDVRPRAAVADRTGNADLLAAALQRRGRRARASARPRPADSGTR